MIKFCASVIQGKSERAGTVQPGGEKGPGGISSVCVNICRKSVMKAETDCLHYARTSSVREVLQCSN